MYLIVPLSLTVSGAATQADVVRLVVCCKFQPVEGDGQETMAVFVIVIEMVSAGAPAVGTAEMRAQKPPAMLYSPPIIVVPASC